MPVSKDLKKMKKKEEELMRMKDNIKKHKEQEFQTKQINKYMKKMIELGPFNLNFY